MQERCVPTPYSADPKDVKRAIFHLAKELLPKMFSYLEDCPPASRTWETMPAHSKLRPSRHRATLTEVCVSHTHRELVDPEMDATTINDLRFKAHQFSIDESGRRYFSHDLELRAVDMQMFSPTLVAMRSLLSRGQAKPDGTWWRRQPCRDHVVESASTQGLRPAWPQAEPSWALQGATGCVFRRERLDSMVPDKSNGLSGHFVHVRGYIVPSNPEDRPLLNARSKVEVISLEPTSKDSGATSGSGNAATSWCNLSDPRTE